MGTINAVEPMRAFFPMANNSSQQGGISSVVEAEGLSLSHCSSLQGDSIWWLLSKGNRSVSGLVAAVPAFHVGLPWACTHTKCYSPGQVLEVASGSEQLQLKTVLHFKSKTP